MAGSDKVWKYSPLRLVGPYPGWHRDDWETYQLRIESNGDVYARAGSHGHYQGCKQADCENRWVPATGWTRVSRGSHAGHIPFDRIFSRERAGRGPRPLSLRPRYPGARLRERTTTAEGLRLVPLERVDHGAYRPLDRAVRPPWRKSVYGDPESDES